VLPQMLAASLLGFLVNQFFGGETIYVLITGGASMILSGLLTLRVDDDTDVHIQEEGELHVS